MIIKSSVFSATQTCSGQVYSITIRYKEMAPKRAAEETVFAMTKSKAICLLLLSKSSFASVFHLVRAERVNHTKHFLFLEDKDLLLKVLTQLSNRFPLSPYCSIPQRTVLMQIINNSSSFDLRGAVMIYTYSRPTSLCFHVETDVR